MVVYLRIIDHPLNEETHIVKELSYEKGKSVAFYIKDVDLEGKCVVFKGSNLPPNCLDKATVEPYDVINIIPNIGWELAAFIWGVGEVVYPYLAVASFAYSVYAYVTADRGGVKEFKDDPTYGWDGIHTVQEPGRPVQIIYGEHRCGGMRINTYISGAPSKIIYDYVVVEVAEFWKRNEVQEIYGWVASYVTDVLGWQLSGVSGVYNSDFINEFTTVADCTGFQFSLEPQSIQLAYASGSDVRTATQLYTDCSAEKNDGGDEWARFVVHYKKTSDSIWTLWHDSIQEGLVMVQDLDKSQYNVRIEIDSSDITGIDNSDIYYSDLQFFVTDPVEMKYEENLQFYNSLIAFGEGEIDSISQPEINGEPFHNLSTGAQSLRLHLRKGLRTQDVIPGMEDLHDLGSYKGILFDTLDQVETFTTDKAIDAYELHFTAPNGILYQHKSGGIDSGETNYKIEHKLDTEATWSDLGTQKITGKTRSPVRAIFRAEVSLKGVYDIRITKKSPASDPRYPRDFRLDYIDEVLFEDLMYPNTVLIGIKHLATKHLHGSVPNTTFLIKGLKVSQPKIVRDADSVELDYDEYYYDLSAAVYKDRHGAAASWDGTTWVTKWTANPIWCARDFIRHNRYGLGDYVNVSLMDDNALFESAKYCDEMVKAGVSGTGSDVLEKRFRLDINIDTRQKALDLIQALVNTFRGFAFYSLGRIEIGIDKPESSRRVIGMGNIVRGSFTEKFRSYKESYNNIRVQYLDREENFVQEIVGYSGNIISGQDLRSKNFQIYGVTRRSQAVREARYIYNVSQYIDRSIGFRAGIDCIVAKVGKVFDFSHDVPQWGFSGRIFVSSSLSDVQLDQEVTLAANTTYYLRVQHQHDTIETLQVKQVGVETTTSDLELSDVMDSDLYAYDKYQFGELATISKPFRILSLLREGNDEVSIGAVEYNSTIYDDPAFVKPTANYSRLSLGISVVANIVLEERLVKLLDGTIQSAIDVFWEKPLAKSGYIKEYDHANIYVSESSDLWSFEGQSIAGSSRFTFMRGSDEIITYKIKVATVTRRGEELSLDRAPSDAITIYGKTTKPDNVQGFGGQIRGMLLEFDWDGNSDVDLAGYELRLVDANWGEDTVDEFQWRGRVDAASWHVSDAISDAFYIKAFDTSGNYSSDAVVVDISDTGEWPAGQVAESVTRKWAGETGADVTANHEAATIANQGALALLDAVDTGQIVNTAVTEAKLASLAVTLAKLADNAVSSDKIVNLAITEGKLAALSVSLGKMAADSVDKDKLTVPGVDADGKLVLGQIGSGDADNIAASATRKWAGEAGATVDQTGAEIKTVYEVEANAYTDTKNTKLSGVATSADVTGDNTAAGITGQGALATLNTVNTAQIDNNAIVASKILAGEIGTAHLVALAVTAGKIAALAIETDKLAANAVTAAKIAAGTITAIEMAALSIGTRELIAESITATKIASLAIETDKIAANAVTAGKILVASLGAIHATLGTVVAGVITGTTITGGTIRTASSGRRIKMDSDGIKFMSASPASGKVGTTANGGDNIVIGTTANGGDNEVIGSGYLVRFYNMSNGVPFYVQSEQTVADIHYFNRANTPSGAAEVGDTCVVQGKHETCTVAGTPGTWVVTGDQVA